MDKKKMKSLMASREICVKRLDTILGVAKAAQIDASKLTEFRVRFEDVTGIYAEFNLIHSKIIQLNTQEDNYEMQESEDELRVGIDEKYYSIRSIYFDLFESKAQPKVGVANNTNMNIKLPKISLPTFDGDFKAWATFYDLFTTLVHNNTSLGNIEKFQYLLSSLSKEPLNVVRMLPLSDNNYEISFQALVQRYQNKRLLATTYLDALLNANSATAKSAKELRVLVDTFNENLSALNLLGFPTDSWDFVLFNLLLKKVDSSLRTSFEKQFTEVDIPTFKNLADFLITQSKVLETVGFESSVKVQFNLNTQSRQKKSVFLMQNQDRDNSYQKCRLCNGEHFIGKCSRFVEIDTNERFKFVKQHNLCLNCLRQGHRVGTCNSSFVCKYCNKKHNSLLHFEQKIRPVEATLSNQISNVEEAKSSANNEVNVYTNTCSSNRTVLLSTAIINIVDGLSNIQPVRVLLDSASQANIMTVECANRLSLPRRKLMMDINCLGQASTAAHGLVNCCIKSNDFELAIDALIIPKISSLMPSTFIPFEDWQHIKNLSLADPNFNKPGKIDMLLGAEVFSSVVKGSKIVGKRDEPVALDTLFGWVLMGSANCKANHSINSFHVHLDTSLDAILKSFWQVEEVENISCLSEEDIRCENIFKHSHTRTKLGRYKVQLPFKESEPMFHGTRNLALRRFYSLERRLENDNQLRLMYHQVMEGYLSSSHMEILESPTDDFGKKYYIPHHCVIKPSSKTTKLRVVFDASARDTRGISLNDTLLVGQKLQRDIASVLLNFRLHAVAITADVEKMFRQILVSEQHLDYQRIVWRFSPDEPIKDYRLKTVTFGVTSAPFLAIRTLKQLAADEQTNLPRAAHVLESDVYVDDIVTGCDSVSDALILKRELIELCYKGGFKLQKWLSNCTEFNLSNNIDSLPFDSDSETVKILGLKWDPSRDSFSYTIETVVNNCTKREILSELARIFDPLGFLAPLTFFAKYLIQHLWSLGLNWDDIPPADVVNRWNQYKSELYLISQINIARFYNAKKSQLCELHGFGDASEKGYAAVVYCRCVDANGDVSIHLLCAKSKVAPLKRLSLPRLELCGAHLLAKLIDFVVRTYSSKIEFSRKIAWSDSTIALSWIKSSPHRWKTFVSNRVSYIQDKIPPDSWRHVRSGENPADCGSRGLLPAEFISHEMWWNGPPFLWKDETGWPADQIKHFVNADIDTEERKISLAVLLDNSPIETLIDRRSSLSKIQRILAYCRRFARRSELKGSITQRELDEALMLLVKSVQRRCFIEDIINLEKKRPISKLLRKLDPFLDENGVLRVGGRLRHSKLAFDSKFPALLPAKHRLTYLIIENFHNKHLHPGLQTLQYLLLQEFWILSPKRAIRHCLSNCYKCFRCKPSVVTVKMGDLPSTRISQVKPFSYVGVDYGGPFSVTLGKHRGCKSQKAYICLFVCFATKAIHLELVSDLSTEAFLAALRRFISRRGRCNKMFSDCGTNFVGASKQLQGCMKEATDAEKIEWSFNPPSAPHFGGLWEAGIKSVKTHLSRIIGEQVLTFEEFYTVLVQIEAVLNSRPLCPLSSDPNDLSVLTPGHFLTLEPLTAVPSHSLQDINVNRLSRWQLLQRMHHDFWKRWHIEYLHTLTQRHKWQDDGSEIEIGMMVLIKSDILPPLRWPLGRIVSIHPGSDGVCRVATVRTVSGVIDRPVVKLCPLPSQ